MGTSIWGEKNIEELGGDQDTLRNTALCWPLLTLCAHSSSPEPLAVCPCPEPLAVCPTPSPWL